MILTLFAASYPYHLTAEQTFLRPEIAHLAAKFERVILVPETIGGERDDLPANVAVDESFAALAQTYAPKTKTLFNGLHSSLVYTELRDRPKTIIQSTAFKRLIEFASKAELTRRWATDFMARRRFDTGRLIFYTYWLDASAMGLGLVKRAQPRLVAISRAHGYDLYEARHSHHYIPCRPRSLRLIDRVFPDSEAGTRYLADRFPWFASKCETARLGITEPGFVTQASSDGVVRIVSCSFVVPVKRIDLLLKGITAAATQRPQQRFEWYHFGNGPLREAIAKQAEAMLPLNAKRYFPGYSTAADLMQFYRENPIDVFANVSESEGTPVSVMEAIGCGLPVIATAVGGNQEIVSDQNGQLIGPNPTPDEIAAAIFGLVDDPNVAACKRAGSRQVWHEKYDADQNFQHFADRLIEIRQTV